MTVDVYANPCQAANPVDLSGDCAINLKDLAAMYAKWIDGSDIEDLAAMAAIWLVDFDPLTEPVAK